MEKGRNREGVNFRLGEGVRERKGDVERVCLVLK